MKLNPDSSRMTGNPEVSTSIDDFSAMHSSSTKMACWIASEMPVNEMVRRLIALREQEDRGGSF
jgi:hypothetical protein